MNKRQPSPGRTGSARPWKAQEGRRRGQARAAERRFGLTTRQQQVLRAIVRGHENKQIAADLGLAEQTVKTLVSRLFRKFSVSNRAALAHAFAFLEFTGTVALEGNWIPQLFRGVGIQIAILRGPELRYVAANEAFLEAVGDRTIIGRTLREAWPEFAGTGHIEATERVYARGEALIVHELPSTWSRRDVSVRTFVDLLLQPLHDAEGAVNGLAFFALDVTHLVGRHQQDAPSLTPSV